jgi:hypothetical protein
LRNKLSEFQQRSQNIYVIILLETWLDEAESVYLKGFDKLKYSRKDGLYDGDGKIEVRATELYSGEDT